MRTMILAVAAMLSFGGLTAYADSGDDGGIIANTYFNERSAAHCLQGGLTRTAPVASPHSNAD